MSEALDVLDRTLKSFLADYAIHPYTQYTEHGVHAYFFARLYAALPDSARYLQNPPAQGRVCRIQKEYPTPTSIEKSRRQGWDICLLSDPWSESRTADPRLPIYDRLDTEAIIEFGLNADRNHLTEDIRRLAHSHVCADRRYAVHLMRVSEARGRVSNRDISDADQRSIDAKNLDWVHEAMSMHKNVTSPVTVFVCRPDVRHPRIWKISTDRIEEELSPLVVKR